MKAFFGYALQRAQTAPGPRRCQQRADLLFMSTGMGRTRATNILTKQNPFGKIRDLAALACQQPKKCRQDIALVPLLAGASVRIYLTYPCWFPLHGYKLSHPVNTAARHENINPFCVYSHSSLYSQCQHHGNSNAVTWDSFLANAHSHFE